MEKLLELEESREKAVLDCSRARFLRNNGNLMEYHRGGETQQGRIVIARLCAPFAAAVEEFMEPAEKGAGWNGGEKKRLRALLAKLPLTGTEIAFCALKAVLNEYFRPDGDGLLSAHAHEIGRLLVVSAEFREFERKDRTLARRVVRSMARKRGGVNNKYGYMTLKSARREYGVPDCGLSHKDRFAVGSKLIELLVKSTGAFRVERARLGRRNTPVTLRATDELLDLVQKCAEWFAELQPPFPLMVVPPQEWRGLSGGGYLLPLRALHPPLVKAGWRELAEIKTARWGRVTRAVNAVQNTAWQINRAVYETACELWKRGGGVAGLAPVDVLETPLKPWPAGCTRAEFRAWREANTAKYFEWAGKAQRVHKENLRNATARLRVACQLQVARENVEFERVYFPWFCDFRGRMYAMPSYVNPQSDDLGRALLTFAEGRRIGVAGLYWLKVHLANCAGVDKVSNEERVKWVDEHEQHILASAEKPLEFLWWSDMDAPFQFLAACFEYAGARREGAGFLTTLPVSVDGTCNGLQHLSALLLDPVGGKAVNLVPSSEPADIYTDVLNVLRRKVEADKAKEGTEEETEANRVMAAAWLPHLNRALVKRPVMTTPYGVSRYGIMDQLLEMLVEKRLFYYYAVPALRFAEYLAPRLQEAVGEVVTAAPLVMDWLRNATRSIAEKDKEVRGLYWQAPLSGFPVLQRYPNDAVKKIQLFIGGQRVRLNTRERNARKLDRRRQVLGISPNLIHALDAAMLTETVNRMSRSGIRSFAMVHDSYGTHACCIPRMHELLRRVFVELYSERNVLKDLKEEWESRYGVELPDPPARGTLDISRTTQARYFFS